MATHSQIAHRWAQDNATLRQAKSFNMFTERRPSYSPLFAEGSDVSTIFSHGTHFPIASFVTTPSGQRVCLLTLRDYSVSTSAHKREVRSALSGPVFEVEHVDPTHKPGGAERFHEDNLADLFERAAKAYLTGLRARTRRAWHLDQAEDYIATAQRYSAAFGLEAVTVELAELATKVAERQQAELAQLSEERRADDARRAADMAEARKRDFDAFQGWQAGHTNHCPASYRTDPEGNAYMRRAQRWAFDTPVSVLAEPLSESDTIKRVDVLQTSQGADVPWSDAVKVFHFVHSRRSAGATWVRREGDAAPRAGHFQVDAVEPDGSFRAGCHRFAWAEIERLAKREGVL